MRSLSLLLVIALAAAAPLASAQDNTFTVTQHNDDGFYFRIDGSGKNPTLTLQAGQTYTFEVSNEGTAPHDFNLGSLGATSLLSPGESETLTVTVPSRGGPDQYWCNPHRSAGMEGDVVIQGAADESTPSLGPLAALGLLGLVALRRR